MPNINRAWGEDNGARSAAARKREAPDRNASNGQPQERNAQRENDDLQRSIENFVGDDMGYLKVRRGLDSQDVHLTWQFANGEHHGTYVYVRVEWWQVSYGLQLLIQKRDEVYSGSRIPTPDKRNPSHK